MREGEQKRILIENRHSQERYLISTNNYTLKEFMDILAYLLKKNDEVCTAIELSVFQIYTLLEKYFGFSLNKENYYDIPRSHWKKKIGRVKEVHYDFDYLETEDRNNIYFIDLIEFRSQYIILANEYWKQNPFYIEEETKNELVKDIKKMTEEDLQVWSSQYS